MNSGPAHPETEGAREIHCSQGQADDHAPRSLAREEALILAGKAEGKPCEALIDGDGMVRRGKVSLQLAFSLWNSQRTVPAHIKAMRDSGLAARPKSERRGLVREDDLQWAGRL